MKNEIREWLIGIGFVYELTFFIWTGMFLISHLYYFAFAFFIFGVITAYLVGRLIEKNSIENYKRGSI